MTRTNQEANIARRRPLQAQVKGIKVNDVETNLATEVCVLFLSFPYIENIKLALLLPWATGFTTPFTLPESDSCVWMRVVKNRVYLFLCVLCAGALGPQSSSL